MTNSEAHAGDHVRPDQVAMLCQGDEVYGVGTVLKIYASALPTLWFVALTEGPLVEWLRANGNRVDVVPGMVKLHEGGRSLATILKMPLVALEARRDAARIDALLRPRGVRFVHSHWRPQQIMGGFLRHRGYRSVWHIHKDMDPSRLLGLGKVLNHRLARWGADCLIPVSDFIARHWRGCDVPIHTILNSAAPLFDSANELPLEGPVRTLVAGRLEASKGHHVAVEAVAAARRAGCDITLDVYGGPLDNNPYVDELRQTIATAGIESAVRLLGFCDDLRRRHQQYHLGLQCRIDPEPCSMWVCETLVDGLPLVASANGGTPELVADGVTGFFYPSGSATALAERLIFLSRERQLLSRMRQATFERGARLFTGQRFVAETFQVYSTLMS